MYTPDFDQFCALAEQGNLVPVSREILADLETPVSAFLKIDDGGDAFLLESVEEAQKWGRYSFLGVAPELVFRSKGHHIQVGPPGVHVVSQRVADPFTELQDFLGQHRPVPLKGLPPFCGGAVGYLGYDLVRFFERLPERAVDDLDVPDQYFMLVDTLLLFDNTAQKIKVVGHAQLDGATDLRTAYDATCAKIDGLIARLKRPVEAPTRLREAAGPPSVSANVTQAQYEDMVRCAKEYIVAGDIIQVVLAQRFQCTLRAHPFNIYRALRTVNPSPYMFYLRLGGHTLIGSSPEVMVRLEGREITVRPIAGTRPRGTEERRDTELEHELTSDPKEIAEHIMLVDLGRNDVGRVAKIGSVAVTERMIVERYSHVMHLVSNVRGELARGQRLLRRVPRHVSSRHTHWRSEDSRHGDHRRAGARPAWCVWRRRGLFFILGQHGYVHHDPDHPRQRRRHLHPSWSRHRGGFRPRTRASRMPQQGARHGSSRPDCGGDVKRKGRVRARESCA